MKYTSIALLAVLGLADAHRHHHHIHYTFAQKDEDKAATPDSNRALFDKDVKIAADIVALEHKSEKERTSTHKAAMASQYKATFDKNAATRTKHEVEQVENNVDHKQWVLKNKHQNWAQLEGSPDVNRGIFDKSVNTASDVVAKQKADMAESNAYAKKSQADAAAATTAKKNGIVAARMNQVRNNVKKSRDSIGWRLVWPVNSTATSLVQGNDGSPENSYKAKKQAVDDAAEVTKQERSQEAATTATIGKNHADAATESADYSTNSKQLIDNVRRGGAPAARDALGWRMQTGSQDLIGPAGYEPHVYAFVKPNIIYQSADKSETKW